MEEFFDNLFCGCCEADHSNEKETETLYYLPPIR